MTILMGGTENVQLNLKRPLSFVQEFMTKLLRNQLAADKSYELVILT